MESSCKNVSLSRPWTAFSILWIIIFLLSLCHLPCKKKNREKNKNNKYSNRWETTYQHLILGKQSNLISLKAHPLFSQSHPVHESGHRSRLWPINNKFTLQDGRQPQPHPRASFPASQNYPTYAGIDIVNTEKRALSSFTPCVYFFRFLLVKKSLLKAKATKRLK